MLCAKLGPGDPLAGEKECPEGKSGGEPDRGAAGGGSPEAEPLVHQVRLAKHTAARNFGADGADKKDGGVEPENRGNRSGQPIVDQAAVRVEVTVCLGYEENADERGER